MNPDRPAKSLPNYSRRILWVFLGQTLLLVASFSFALFLGDVFSARLCQIIVLSLLILTPLMYLAVLAKPIMRLEWREILRSNWSLTVSIGRALGRLFYPGTFMKLAQSIASLKPTPTTVDGWITLCVLPFKTCIIATFPMIWTFEKIVSHSAYFRPYGRTFGLSFELMFKCYGISLLALLLGALLQGIFCHVGRATTTLRFFLFGLILFVVLALAPRVFSF